MVIIMWNFNSGYIGKKMSVRAAEAYDSGEMPLSKWSKTKIVSSINEFMKDDEWEIHFDLEKFKKLSLNEMRSFLYASSWHHTGSFYSKTKFYSLDGEKLENLRNNDIDNIIKARIKEPRFPKVKPSVLYITALVSFTNWEGTRKHPKPRNYVEVVYYKSNEKLVRTSCGMKRLSSLTILNKVEQKTRFADRKKVEAKK